MQIVEASEACEIETSSVVNATMIILGGLILGILWSIQPGHCAQAETFTKLGNSQILWVENKYTFDSAEKYCKARGSKLIELRSESEWKEVSFECVE